MIEPYYQEDGITIYNGDNCDVLGTLPKESVDMVITSPPYDDLRTYGGHSWDFYGVAWQLKRVLKSGGVIVWVVADQTTNFCETDTSLLQSLHFKNLGLYKLDTMIYEKQNYAPMYPGTMRYASVWEYMFIFSKGKPSTFHPVQRVKAESTNQKYLSGGKTKFINKAGVYLGKTVDASHRDTKDAPNLWRYAVGNEKNGHPAPFPKDLARDHILSWSNVGDTVLDPFNGSGTTTTVARNLGRNAIGIDIHEPYCAIAKQRLQQGVLDFAA